LNIAEKKMKKKTLFFALVALAFAVVGCQPFIIPAKIDTASIPDRTYEVTVHESNPIYYAVLFDIPDDGKEVAMFYTYFTNRIGMDTPGKYIDHLDGLVKGYRTLQINDEDGTVRGYLLLTNVLRYRIYSRRRGETVRIIVQLDDPNLNGGGIRRRRR